MNRAILECSEEIDRLEELRPECTYMGRSRPRHEWYLTDYGKVHCRQCGLNNFGGSNGETTKDQVR